MTYEILIPQSIEELAEQPPAEETPKQELITIVQLPIIEERLQTIGEQIEAQMAHALSLDVTEETKVAIKKLKAELTASYKELDAQRIAIKKAVLEPYNALEASFKKNVTDKFKPAEEELNRRIKEVDDGLKAKKEETVKKYFYEYAASLGFNDLEWESSKIVVTLSVSDKKLKEQAKSFVDKVNEDVEWIKSQEHSDEILVEYYKLFNAMQAANVVNNRHKAIEEQKQRQMRMEQQRAERAVAEERVETAVESIKAEEAPLSVPETLAQPMVEIPEAEKIYEVSFTVRGTKSRISELKHYLIKEGYING